MAITPGAPGPTTPLSPPTITVDSTDTTNTISWDAVAGATAYNLYWSTTDGVSKINGTQITGVTSPHVHSGLTNGTTYYYVATTEDALSESDESAQVSGTPPVPAPSSPLDDCSLNSLRSAICTIYHSAFQSVFTKAFS